MEIRSEAFQGGGNIPAQYTGVGADISPDLKWRGAPEETLSFVMIMDDPDAPLGAWVHWVVYDIPSGAGGLKKNMPKVKNLGDGTTQGINGFRAIGYGGPHPPPGPAHRYVFKLYALDAVLGLSPGASKEEVTRAMKGHVLEEANLTGLFGM